MDAICRSLRLRAGFWAGWAGRSSPFLLIAAGERDLGTVQRPAGPLWRKLLRRLIAIDAISVTIGDMVRWAALALVLITA
jgi:hypothetical protein